MHTRQEFSQLLVPLDSESGHTRLLCKHVPPHAVNVWLRGGFSVELFGVVFIVDVVANPDKLSAIVAACEEDDGDAENLGCRDASEVWGVGFEYEFVHADGDGPDEERIELLVML